MRSDPGLLTGFIESFLKTRFNRISSGNMSHDSTIEESALTLSFGPVNKLINQNEMLGSILLLKRTHCGNTHNRIGAHFLESVDIRAVIYFAWSNVVSEAVARKKPEL